MDDAVGWPEAPPGPKRRRKIVQIVRGESSRGPVLSALCDDGTLWNLIYVSDGGFGTTARWNRIDTTELEEDE